MQICLLVPEYHTEAYRAGGIGRHAAKLAHWLVDHGHHICVCVPGQDDSFQERPGIEVHRFQSRNLWHWRLSILPRPRWLSLLEQVLGARDIVARLHKSEPFDIIHVFGGLLAAGVVKQSWPVVARSPCHTMTYLKTNFRRVGRQQRVLMALENYGYRKADEVYTSTKADAILQQKTCRRKFEVIHTPMMLVQEPEYSADGGYVSKCPDLPDKYIFFGSGMMGYKGADLFADALHGVFDQCSDIHAVILKSRVDRAPDGKQMDHYFDECLSGYEDRVHYVGNVSHAVLMEILRKAFCVVMPSRHDNLPNLMMEAMWMGTPVVGCRMACFVEFLEDGLDGFLFDKLSGPSLSEKLNTVLMLKGKKVECIGLRAKIKAEDLFDPAQVMCEIVELYRIAIRGRK